MHVHPRRLLQVTAFMGIKGKRLVILAFRGP